MEKLRTGYFAGTCDEADAFVVLTRQGVVLTSDDARITREESRFLNGLNRKLVERKVDSFVK